jgi:hypothetical protein
VAIFRVDAKRYRLVGTFDGHLVTLDEISFEFVLDRRYTMLTARLTWPGCRGVVGNLAARSPGRNFRHK